MPTIQEQDSQRMGMIVARSPDGKYDFTHGELLDALNQVVNKDNWKVKIDTIIPLEGDPERQIAAIKEAVKFICGCEAAVNYTYDSTLSKPIVSVMAPGYYICAGA